MFFSPELPNCSLILSVQSLSLLLPSPSRTFHTEFMCLHRLPCLYIEILIRYFILLQLFQIFRTSFASSTRFAYPERLFDCVIWYVFWSHSPRCDRDSLRSVDRALFNSHFGFERRVFVLFGYSVKCYHGCPMHIG